MKRISVFVIFIVCLVYISSFAKSVIAQEEEIIVTDKILEMQPEKRVIQVGNRQYYVTTVFIDNGTTDEPRTGLYFDLKVGDIVELHITPVKTNGFWQTKKAILYKGKKEKEFLENL